MSSSIGSLPSFFDHFRAKSWFDETPLPRSQYWNAHERPLGDNRTWCHRLEKHNNYIQACLHHTSIVRWYDDNRITLDIGYESATTRQFANRYTPYRVTTWKGQQCLSVDGVMYNNATPFEFINECNEFGTYIWRLTSTHYKPTKTVLDPEKRKQIDPLIKPFARWARDIWAVCGNEGAHPWVGHDYVQFSKYPSLRDLLEEQDFTAVAQRYIPYYWQGSQRKYSPVAVATLLAAVRRDIYKQEDAYMQVPYDT